jgi:enterobactin synthetase component F
MPDVSSENGDRAYFPLTEAQEGLWYAQRIDPDNPIFNTGQYLELRGAFDVAALQAAVAQAHREADALAVRMIDGDDGPKQVVEDSRRAMLLVVDLRDRGDPAREAVARMRADLETPLDPTRDPLAVETLFLLGDDYAYWYQRVHHLALDAYGYALLVRRICDLYNAAVSGREPTTQALGSYTAVLAQDQEYRASPAREASRKFWLTEFADRPEVVAMVTGDAVTASYYLRQARPLPAIEPPLKAVAARSGVSWPDVLTAIAAAYIARHIRRDEVIVGIPHMGRLGTAAVTVPATIMNVLPLRLVVDESTPLDEWLKTTALRLRQYRRHGRYRGEQIRRDLGLVSQQRRLHGPLINVVPFERPPELAGAAASLHTLGTGPVDDMTITLRADSGGGGLHLELDANPNLYTEARVSAHADRFTAFLEAALGAERLADVPTLTAAEHRRLAETLNAAAHPIEDTTLTALLEAAMRRTPDAEALVGDGESLTYAELDRRTATLAGLLADAGVRRGDIVAVALPRSIDLVLSLVAVLRAGGAYLPVDLSHPPERIATTLRLAGPGAVVTGDSWLGQLATDAPIVLVENARPERMFASPVVEPGDAAYVIYTSGSTGEPKGVVIEHRAIVNRLEWMRSHYRFGPADRILQKTPATFDVSVWEFFLAFISGGTLVVAPPDAHKDPAWLVRLIRDHRITTLHFVPSLLELFVAEPSATGLRLHRVFCSGEALAASLRDRFHEVVDAELHNLYGPTEAAVDVTYWDASRGDRSSPVPIGWPVWNTQMYILDRAMRPVPPGVAADLYIGGVQLARAYLGRPDLTADRFIASPFGESERLYKTGDIAEWRDDGAIVFLGRSDHQVKLRGFRIELGEIEAELHATGAVAHAAVIARTSSSGDQQLVAYLVPHADRGIDLDAVRVALQRKLPDYMVPSAFVPIAALPLTRSGKLDRSALPVPATSPAVASGRPAETVTERAVAALFAEVLALDVASDGLGVDDDFFSLGGHSLTAARLMARVRQQWRCDLGLGVLFANPTIARLASAVAAETGGDRTRTDHGLGPVIRLVDGEAHRAPLFCIHPAGGISWCYGALARALAPRRDVYGLQAPGLDPSVTMPERLDDLAAQYADLLVRTQPDGPYHLLGWSVGGIIAHAMAVRLQAAGRRVGVLAMLDAYPSDRWRSQPEPEARAVLRAILLIAGHDPAAMGDLPMTRESVIAFLRRARHPLGELSDAALTGIIRVVGRNNALVRRHVHQRYEGSLLYFRAALDHREDGLTPGQWRPYVSGAIDIHDVPVMHAHLTGAESVARVAPVVSGWLNA